MRPYALQRLVPKQSVIGNGHGEEETGVVAKKNFSCSFAAASKLKRASSSALRRNAMEYEWKGKTYATLSGSRLSFAHRWSIL